MALRNYLIEGPSGSGKTSICDELLRRGLHAIHGDRVLAYQGDPETGTPLEGFSHDHHIWDIAKLTALTADTTHEATFFCGGARNHSRFLHLFDKVFVLETDPETLAHRLATRPASEFGGTEADRAFIARRLASGKDRPPNAFPIDATQPLTRVTDAILAAC